MFFGSNSPKQLIVFPIFFVFSTAISSCASNRQVDIKLDVTEPKTSKPRSAEHQLNDLTEYLDDHPDDQALLTDVKAMLYAMDLEAKKASSADIVKAWWAVVPHAEGAFGERAVKGWVQAYCRNLGRKTDKNVLAKLMLAETQAGNLSPWMVERAYANEQAMANLLEQWVPDYLEADSMKGSVLVAAPSKAGIPSDDPVLLSLASRVCEEKLNYGSGWNTWRASLKPYVSQYFDALVLDCSGEASKAADVFLTVAPKLAAQNSTAPLALEAYSRAIKIRRDQGEREEVAPLFLPLMRVWKVTSVDETTLGMSADAFELRRINDALSAARHRALVNDHENAKIFVQDGLNYISNARNQAWAMTPDMKTQLANLSGEAYHFLAFRLAVEERDWDRAGALTVMALEVPSLSKEWLQRLQWSLGLYAYLGGKFDVARVKWEQMLSDQSDDNVRAMLLFWIAQAHTKLGNLTEADFYRRSLTDDYPLNYYSVYALKEMGSPYSEEWKKRFGDIAAMHDRLDDWDEVDLSNFLTNEQEKRELRRAQILIAARVESFQNLALDKLQKYVTSEKLASPTDEFPLYLSRLYAAAGNWNQSILLTTRIAKAKKVWSYHPEQFLVFFPMPYMDIYRQASLDTGVSVNELMAISRQESAFNAGAKSPANAFGLMQLTAATARRTSVQSSIQVAGLPESLLWAEPNIRLGASYFSSLLTRYKGNKSLAYAAYNAGERTVDNWKDLRPADDPLAFIELIPYLETRQYVKNVLRNDEVYLWLRRTLNSQAE